ncbi:MAG TPA: response regulator [Candidatus Kapabacteria bacterium]|nr:response regulator [Candidatus Kapabacteria bacterium]
MENYSICVIEDNMPIRKLYITLLKKSGFTTFDFGDGSAALEWLKTNKVNGIIMDILLPDINGNDLVKQVNTLELHKNTPICAITGFAQENDRQKFLNDGFSYYLTKPIDTATFVDKVKEMFNLK